MSYHYGDEEVVDELWNIKYTGSYEESPENVEEMINTVAKCNVSERVWSNLLDRFGEEFGLKKLLLVAVESYAPNAAKVTDMILHRCDRGIIKEKVSSVCGAVLEAACNEGDWAAEIMQVLLKHGGQPNVVDKAGYTPVHRAAQNESSSGPKIIRLLLQYGANPNIPLITNKTTPVHLAALNQGDYAAEILKQLLDSGGACHAIENSNMFEPIHCATVNSGDSALELLQLLLGKRGIDVIHGRCGWTLLHLAMVNEGDCGPKILKKLLESGMNPNVVDKYNRTPLHVTSVSLNIENQNISLMRDLLENGGDPNAVDENGWTPVHFAAGDWGEYGYEKLKLLFLYEGNVSINGTDGLTPLHCAILMEENNGSKTRDNTNNEEAKQRIATKKDQINRVQLILDNGGNPNAQNSLGRSPLHLLVIQNGFSDKSDVLQLLLKKGGNPNLLDQKQMAPIHYAAGSISETAPPAEMMKILLKFGGDANLIGGEQGVTPLHFAAKNMGNLGNHGLQLTEILLEHGGNSNAQDNLGRSPVHFVVSINECSIALEILKLLLKKGGDPNLLDKKEHFAPLHYAADGHKEKGPEKIKILLENDADPNLNGGEGGLTPLHIACVNSEIHGPTITRILLENGGNPNAADLHKHTPLHLAIQQNENDQLRLETIELLLEKGANPNAGDIIGMTPVHYVVINNRSNSLKALKLLLGHGGKILQEDNFGMTPHRLATQMGSKQYCQPEVKKLIVKMYRKMK
jgi:ankyrin repeat protein